MAWKDKISRMKLRYPLIGSTVLRGGLSFFLAGIFLTGCCDLVGLASGVVFGYSVHWRGPFFFAVDPLYISSVGTERPKGQRDYGWTTSFNRSR
jgi:hypothetical protein